MGIRRTTGLQARTPLKAKTPLRAKNDKRKWIPLHKKTAAQLVKVADQYFSKYVRMRDSKFLEEFDGWYGTCITCSKAGLVVRLDETEKLRFASGWDAGHFISRAYKIIRFDEENVNLQCGMRCNRMRSGEHEKYRLALDLKYGEGTALKLEQCVKEYPVHSLKKDELLQIIEDSRKQLKFMIDNRYTI